jgi:Iap family predicted aminopeptidase
VRSFRYLSCWIVCCLLMVSTLGFSASQGNKIIISTQEETAQDVAQVPCKQTQRLSAARALFIKMGAQAENVLIEKRDGVENLVIRKPGNSQGTIVIGAHYDKLMEGCGAIDNWTGIVALAHIYRSLKDVPLQKTLLFVAFGKEEEGLLGSKAMVNNIKKEDMGQYCAMINIDSLGMAAPQVGENLSSKALVSRVVEIAQRMKMPFSKLSIPGAGADSLSFMEKKIPAVTISALRTGWAEVLHTRHDQVSKVNQTSVYLGYRLALALVTELDILPCEVSREKAKAK